MAIVTAAEYKAWAGISASTYDARLAILIPQLQGKLEAWCGRVFDTATFTEKHDGRDHDAILVKNPPIASITSLTITAPDGTGSALASTDYAFDTTLEGRVWLVGGNAGEVVRKGLTGDGFPQSQTFGVAPRYPRGRKNVTIVYVGAYGSSPAAAVMPPGLQFDFMMWLSEVLLFTTAAAGGGTAGALAGILKSKTLGRNSETYRDVNEIFGSFSDRFWSYRRQSL